ncbi:MAG: hypothetical protein IJ834_02620 [Paludibacteraceae bacterium]|nr:hypothetical protein [Paludibacteraceae bacterium]
MKQHLLYIIIVACVLVSCQTNYTTDPNARLLFSEDTLRFDTVFTNITTITKQVMIYNPQKKAIKINKVRQENNKYFQINLDGESNHELWKDITLNSGDSLYMFVKATIDTQDSQNPVLIEDKILFDLNDHTEQLCLEAFGQNVHLIKKRVIESDYNMTADIPYLLLDTLVIGGNLTIQAGTTLYMHNNAALFCLSDVNADGSLQKPIRIMGDRLDDILPYVPYNYVSGSWNGIYLLQQTNDNTPHNYNFNYLEIKSGMVGLYCISDRSSNLPMLKLSNSVIHNFALYGLVLQNIDAEIFNTEISNCASYCVYLSGGKHTFVHNTLAAYFQSMNIQPVSREDVAAIYFNNLSKQTAPMETYFYNNIVTGNRTNNFVLATPLPLHYKGEFRGNYLRCDSLPPTIASDNIYYQTNDTVFNNIYLHKNDDGEGYIYYNFALDSVSKAKNIGIKEYTIKYDLTADRLQVARDTLPDAGCYEWSQQKNANQ